MAKLKLDIDDEALNKWLLSEIKESIFNVGDSLQELKNKKKLKQYEVEDILCHTETLIALGVVYDYYGGNL